MANSIQTVEMLLKDTLAIRERSIKTTETLLEKTSKIRKSCEKQYRENGTAYNVFTAADIGTKEVPMCNVLADLLDPKGLHYRGTTYLELFMQKVVIPCIDKAGKLDLSKAKVNKQSSTSEGRLVDIEINDGKVFIPIEVKIYAGEQPKQLSDYAKDSREKNKIVGFIPVLFLTPDGRKSEAQEEDYVCISFEKDIIPWIEACLELPETKKAPPVGEIIKQYIKAIKSFCGIMEDEEMEKKIIERITKSDENFEAAVLIHDAVDEIYRKGPEIFTNQILRSVKDKFHDHVNIYPEEKKWITIKLKDFQFSVYCDMKQFQVQKIDSSEPFSHERQAVIIGIMSEKIKDSNSAKAERENDIWFSKDARYPGLEKYDGERYIYRLYKIYSENHQSVADYIVSIAKELEKV